MRSKRISDVCHYAAFVLIFGAALLADGLAEIPHGFVILAASMCCGAALVMAGNKLRRRTKQNVR